MSTLETLRGLYGLWAPLLTQLCHAAREHQHLGENGPEPCLAPQCGKVPTRGGYNQDALARFERDDAQEVERHLEGLARHLDLDGGNIGVVLPSSIYVIDPDTREATTALALRLPEAPMQATGRGGHFVVRVPDGVRVRAGKAVDLGDGIVADIKTPGQHIAVEPSAHFSGVPYAWKVALPSGPEEVPEAPPWLVAALRLDDEPSASAAYERGAWDGKLPPRVAELLRNDARLRVRWAGSGEGLTDTSPSGIDLSMATRLALAGVAGGEIEAALRLRRAGAGARSKPPSYYARTVGAALGYAQERLAHEPPPAGEEAGPADPPDDEAIGAGGGGEERELSAAAASRPPRRLIYVTGREQDQLIDEAVQALIEQNKPEALFLRGGRVVSAKVVKDHDDEQRPIVDRLGDVNVRDWLAAAGWWRAKTKRGEKPTGPPRDLAGLVLSRLERTHRLPPLRGITTQPVLRIDGSLLKTPGYDAQTGLLYLPPPGFELPKIRREPTARDIEQARELLFEVVADFPFVSDADRATALVIPFSLVLRPFFALVPLIVIDGRDAGTGKGLLADAMVKLATGSVSRKMPEPTGRESGAEWGKRLTTFLMQGRAIVTLDNVHRTLDSGQLSAFLTAERWTDRVLGRNEDVDLPNQTILIATGNSIRLGGDMPRRVALCQLDAKMAEPWTRTGFKHDPLLDWIGEQRGKCLAAVLTLARAWVVDGRHGPAADVPRLGSFEGWRDTIGGIFKVAGIAGFLANARVVYADANEEGAQWTAFLAAWREAFETQSIRVAKLVETLVPPGGERLRETLPGPMAEALRQPGPSAARRIGHMLRAREGRRFPLELGGRRTTLRLVKGEDKDTKVATWAVLMEDEGE